MAPLTVLDRTEYANDEYPPIEGRVLPNDVLFKLTAGEFLSGDVHVAVRHFTIDKVWTATQVDPIAGQPRDFVLEWLSVPWDESRARSESPSLQAQHTELHKKDPVGDFPQPTLRCTTGADLWQVTTRWYEGPRRYYRVRWRRGYCFTVVSISDTPYRDCTVPDSRGELYLNVRDTECSDLRVVATRQA